MSMFCLNNTFWKKVCLSLFIAKLFVLTIKKLNNFIEK